MAYSLLWVVCSVLMLAGTSQCAHYLGKSLGKLSELHHAVSGHVYAVDGRTLFIKNFKYDGEGPAAYFYVGSGKSPSNVGAQRLRDERGSAEVLKPYRGADITLTLPEGKTLSSVKWFSIWCDEFSVNFGDVKIPRSFDFPKPQKIGALSGVHGVSSDHIVLVDAQTLLIPNFSYDGEAPDAKFWVGRGDKPSPQGTRIPDENGKEAPLIKYDRKTIVLTLPGDLTIFDIRHFGVWCEAFTVDFGHIKIPELPNVPPSLKMLGVSPQKRNQELLSSTSTAGRTSSSSKYQNQGNLKATTYRPPTRFINSAVASLEPSSGRFQAPLNVNDANFQLVYPVAPSLIHRRADDFQPPQAQQLLGSDYNNYDRQTGSIDKSNQRAEKSLIQPSQEIYVNHEPPQEGRAFYNQYPQQFQYVQQPHYQQQIAQQQYQQQQQTTPQQYQQQQQIAQNQYQQQQQIAPQHYQQQQTQPLQSQQVAQQNQYQVVPQQNQYLGAQQQNQLLHNQQQIVAQQQLLSHQYIAQRTVPHLLQNQPQYQNQQHFQQQPLYQNQLVHPQYQTQGSSLSGPTDLERRRYDLDLVRGQQSGGSFTRFSFNAGDTNSNSYAQLS